MKKFKNGLKEPSKPMRVYEREWYEINIIAAKLTKDKKKKVYPADVVRMYWDKVKDWGLNE